MGKATRWFRNLLGMKKENDNHQRDDSNFVDKKRWSFGKSLRDSVCVGQIPVTTTTNPVHIQGNEPSWSKSYYTKTTETEQNKHAIAVAAATAAAADAAVVAAQAAVAVVRLTSHGRGTMFGGGRERWAALKIQTAFRGYLIQIPFFIEELNFFDLYYENHKKQAKKALRALKGLVKLQALVRGYLVRKQATATLHGMQALFRAQLTVRSQKAGRVVNKDQRVYPEFRPRRSIERFDETRSEYTSSVHSRRLSAPLEAAIPNTFDEVPKIVEIDTCRPKSRSRRMTINTLSGYGEDPSNQMLSSSLPCQIPGRSSIPDCKNFQDFDWTLTGDECRFSTAQSTPRFVNSYGSNAPGTPAKSVCTERHFRPYSNFPNYMANTQSFKAKVRSYSAPKQRPESGSRKKISLNEIVESRASLSGVRMQKSQAQEVLFKNAVMGRFDREAEFVREMERNDYYDRRW